MITKTMFAVVAAFGYAVYFFSRGWVWFLIGTVPVMAWSNLALSAIFSVIGDQLPRERRGIGFSVQSLWKRVPIVIAPPVGGGACADGRVGAFVTATGTQILVIASVWRAFQIAGYRDSAFGGDVTCGGNAVSRARPQW
jgi:hypothetical protein